MVQGLLFEGSVLAYDPTANGVKWILVRGSASNLSPAEEASAWELSNIMLHDPTKVTWRMDCFREQRGEGSVEEAAAKTILKGELAEEAMELGYQPGSNRKRTVTAQTVHIPLDTPCNTPPRDAATRAVSAGHWCLSKSEDQHMPGGPRDTSLPTDEDEPVEGSAHSGQESPDATSIRGIPPGESQEDVIVHAKEEIDSLY